MYLEKVPVLEREHLIDKSRAYPATISNWLCFQPSSSFPHWHLQNDNCKLTHLHKDSRSDNYTITFLHNDSTFVDYTIAQFNDAGKPGNCRIIFLHNLPRTKFSQVNFSPVQKQEKQNPLNTEYVTPLLTERHQSHF